MTNASVPRLFLLTLPLHIKDVLRRLGERVTLLQGEVILVEVLEIRMEELGGLDLEQGLNLFRHLHHHLQSSHLGPFLPLHLLEIVSWLKVVALQRKTQIE